MQDNLANQTADGPAPTQPMRRVRPPAAPGDERQQPMVNAPSAANPWVLAPPEPPPDVAFDPYTLAADETETAGASLASLRADWRGMRSRWRQITLLLLALTCVVAPVRPANASLMAAAQQARQVERYDAALAFYAQAHDQNSSDPQPLCASGDIYTLQGLPTQAIAAYRACAALAPTDGSAWLRLGDALQRANDDAGSVAAWKRAAVAGDVAGYERLALRAENQGLLDEAAHWWAQAPQDDEVAQAHLGLLSLAQGNTVAARAHFFTLIRSKSAYAKQLQASGVFFYALSASHTALDEENVGYALLTLGEPTVALEPLRRAVLLAPDDGSASAYYGYTLWLLGQRDDARPLIAAGIANAPRLPFAQYAAGQVDLADGRFSAALAHFQTALLTDTHNPALWNAAGDAALAQRDYVTAELSYGNAAQFSDDPAYSIALLRFYRAHALGMDDGTLARLAAAEARRFPTNEPLLFLQGQIEDDMGHPADAFYLYQRAVALNPTDPGPWFELGRSTLASGDVVPAVVELRTALALQPAGSYADEARRLLSGIQGGAL